MSVFDSPLYWRIRASSMGGALARAAKPLAVLRALIRAHDYSYVLPSEKRDLLTRIARDFGCTGFVETGTLRGDTTAHLADCGLVCTTIELDASLAHAARERFAGNPAVTVLEGDSAQLLPSVVAGVDRTTLFWLDAHCSSGETAGAGHAPPLLQELATVLRDHRFQHCIAVDDARDLLGWNGYPTLRQVASFVERSRSDYGLRLQSDVVIIAPARM